MKLKYALIPKIGTSAFARGSTQLSILFFKKRMAPAL
jgi:hypothetical protein